MSRMCRRRGDRAAAAGTVLTQTCRSDCWMVDKGGFDWRSGRCPSAGFQTKNAGFAVAGSPLSPWQQGGC